LATPADAKDFCDGIVKLLQDHDLRNKMGEQCRAIALEEYSLEIQAQRYIQLYHQILQESCKSNDVSPKEKLRM
jgi:glycosyltransferase involved in cell wall biosynthesis